MDKNWQDKFDFDRKACQEYLRRERLRAKDEIWSLVKKLSLEASIILMICILAVLLATAMSLSHSAKARGAPAPFWRESRDSQAETHPAAMCGWYEVVFQGGEYRAGLDDDGTFRVWCKGETNAKWRGTWGVRGGVLYWREWQWAKCPWEIEEGRIKWRSDPPDPDWKFEFTYRGDCWKSDSTSVRFMHFIKPTD